MAEGRGTLVAEGRRILVVTGAAAAVSGRGHSEH
eukprot:CAMPEP_0177402848 /NCGR_PEP_ID=MMETSP0368-20130122/60482_1 /TAXON_ID=447022 ORGANISM="Scrippsiella hangoei-like, Strain SHHI-4" /NCGR_SAMPLE_ID=MMETSP0368 /ASSEMBLY_ACC=CAM_ASM_000363 /LENGTH=33 /DNA_ID= /DNA_START= /DNA_END= /DNA_ORIENTATION=